MANISSSSNTITGTATGDIILGLSDVTTINGGAGNDVIFGDHALVTVDTSAANTSIGSALTLDASTRWTTRDNPDVGDTAIPATTVLGTGTNTVAFYSVTIGAGETITIDADWANSSVGGPAFDGVVRLLDSTGALVTSDDDSPATDGGLGSTLDPNGSISRDPLLTTTVTAGGTYYIEFGAFATATTTTAIPTNASYMLNVSVTNHAFNNNANTFGNDVIEGGTGSDVLYGVNGNDTLLGNAGNDTLYGGTGGDVLRSGAGIDALFGEDGDDFLQIITGEDETGETYDGGAGTDSFQFFANTGATTFNLRDDTVTAIERLSFSTQFGNDTTVQMTAAQAALLNLIGVSGARGSDAMSLEIFMDNETSLDLSGLTVTGFTEPGDNITVTGDADAETITGTAANDTILGGGGNDTIEGGAGADSLDGGAGIDTLSYAGSAQGVDVQLIAGNASNGVGNGDDQGDTFVNFENLIGSAHGDNLTGNSFTASTIMAGAGNDQLTGLSGANALFGEDGDDVFNVGNSSGSVAAGSVFDGGAGTDDHLNIIALAPAMLDFTTSTITSIERINFGGDDGMSRTLAFMAAQFAGFGSVTADPHPNSSNRITIAMGTETTLDLSALGVTGVSEPGDGITVTGDGDNETITGSAANDTLIGNGGDDVFSVVDSGTTANTIDGGGGIDTLDVSGFTSGIFLGQNSSFNATGDYDLVSGNGTRILNVNSSRVERIIGTNFDDTIHEFLIDRIEAGGGNDTVIVYQLPSASESYDGGTGIDTLDLANGINTNNGNSYAVINLATGTLTNTSGATNFENVIATEGDNTITGTSGSNTIDGAGGDDTIDGGGGDDTINGGAGADSMDGGAGTDTLSYAGSSAGVNVNSSTGVAQLGDAAGDSFTGFERVVLSDFNDSHFGFGMTVNAGAGNDTLQVQGGTDSLAGEDGNDFFDISTAFVQVNSTFDGGNGTDSIRIFGGAGIQDLRDDTLISNEILFFFGNLNDLGVHLNAAQVGQFDSFIAGSHAGHARTVEIDMDTETSLDLSGVTVTGFTEPNDGITINGDSDAETITGSSVNDTIIGGAGADSMDGGAGIDTAGYGNAAASVKADLVNSGVNTGDALGDTYTAIENLDGSAFADDLRGDNNANQLSGNDGNDFLTGRNGDDALIGGAGNDVLVGGQGGDSLDGGDGRDIASYADGAAGVLVDLANIGFNTGIAAGDSYSSIEVIIGSGGSDDLRGDAGDNQLEGRNGNDYLVGRDGNDDLRGGNGDDIILGGAGADRHDGGAGIDTANYADTATGMVIDLASNGLNTGIAAGDGYISIENLIGSGGNDDLRGNNDANRIEGRDGNDFLFGRAGDDTLVGGNGDDNMRGGSGGDVLNGGSGIDSANYIDSAGLRADLQNAAVNNGVAAGDTYISVENLFGSNGGDDLRGDSGANRLIGRDGNDFLTGRDGDDELFGGNGDDLLRGGNGADTLTGNAGDDRFRFDSVTEGVDTIRDFQINRDTIQLNDSGFTSLSTGALSADNFRLTGTAGDADDYIIYDAASGALFYDADGVGGTGAVRFATLLNNAAIDHNDFFII